MPIDAPLLDDRRYDELFQELRRRIPVYTPEWTDHNDSDPGITLLQLFAFLGEGLLFRLNQVPEATQLAFLRLLDIRLRPATAARTMLSFTSQAAGGANIAPGMTALAGKLPFRIENECQAWPVDVVAVARVETPLPENDPEAAVGGGDDPELFEITRARLLALGARMAALGEDTESLQPVGYKPQYLKGGQVGALSFENAVDLTLWLALIKGDPAIEPVAEPSVPWIVNVGFELSEPEASMDAATQCTDGTTPENSFVWEIAKPKVDGTGVEYQRLDVVEDTTVALTRTGITRLKLPAWVDDPPPFAVDEIEEGTGDWPPPLEPDEKKRLWLWIRAYRVGGTPPALSLVAANAAMAVQATMRGPELLGIGSGQPGQRLSLAYHPVLSEPGRFPVQIEVEENGRWVSWEEIEDIGMSATDQRAYAVDAESGEIRFGARGPEIGERVRALRYHHGGGRAGNVPVGAVSKLGEMADVQVSNVIAARGGEDAETVEAALVRIPGEIRRRDRAVTAEDFSELARMTPGAGIARAECLPRFHAPSRRGEQAGMVTVVVWPRDDTFSVARPKPDRASMALVCRFLSERRLVTTELYVAPADYVDIAISVKIAVEPGYGLVAVSRWVETILRQFLSPLPPYGPDGGGWPLGRRVNPRELEATVLQIEGIDYIDQLLVARRTDTGWSEPGSVTIEPYQVVSLSSVVVVGMNDPMPQPGEGLSPPPTGIILPIPVIREVC